MAHHRALASQRATWKWHWQLGMAPTWAHDGSSFHATGIVGNLAATVYEPHRNHSAVFVKGENGHLHYWYMENGNWRLDSRSFEQAGQIQGDIAAVFEPQRTHSAVFVVGEDRYLHYFYGGAGTWHHDKNSFVQAGHVRSSISTVFEQQRNHSAVLSKEKTACSITSI